MDTIKAVKERRSIRKFKPEPVSRELISEILERARWSPSWGNTQSWEFYVVTGEPLDDRPLYGACLSTGVGVDVQLWGPLFAGMTLRYTFVSL